MRLHLMAMICVVLMAVVHPVDAQDDAGCPGAPVLRLVVGQHGRVTPGSANNMRNQPSTSGENIGQIAAGEAFAVLDGPVCADGFNWWQVDANGVIGWTAEGRNDEYWLEPLPDDVVSDTSIAPYTRDELTAFDLLVMLTCPQENIRTAEGIDINADGRFVAFGCGSSDNAFGVYDMATRTLAGVYAGNQGFIRRLYFVPHSELILVVTDDVLALWNLETGEKLVEREIIHIRDIVFIPDGSQFVTNAQSARGVTLWDTATLTEVETLPDDRLSIVDGLAISSDGKWLAAAGRDHSVRLWDLETGEGWFATQAEMDEYISSQTRGITFSSDGRFLVTSTCLAKEYECKRVQIDWWDVANGESVKTWTHDIADLIALRFLPGDDYLVAAGYGDTLVFDSATGEQVPSTIDTGAMQFAISPDGTFLALNDGFRPRILGLSARMAESNPPSASPTAVVPAPEVITCEGFLASRLAAGEAARLIDSINLNVRAEPAATAPILDQIQGRDTVTVLDGPVCADSSAWWHIDYNGLAGWAMEGSGDDYWLEPISPAEMAALTSGALTRHNIIGIQPLVTLGRGMVHEVLWSPDGNTVAVATTAGLWLYDASAFTQEPRHIRAQIGLYTPVVFSPDGTLLASPECLTIDIPFECPTPAVTVWDVATGNAVQRLPTSERVNGVAFNADGTTLAFSSGAVVRFLDVAAGHVARIRSFPQNVKLLGIADSGYYGPMIAIQTGSGPGRHVEFVSSDSGSVITGLFSDAALLIMAPNLSGVFYVTYSPDEAGVRRPDNDLFVDLLQFSQDVGDVFNQDGPSYAAFSPDGRLVAIGTLDGHLYVWDVVEQVEVAHFEHMSANALYQLALSPDGKQAVFGVTYSVQSWDRSPDLFVIDLDTGEQVAQLTGYTLPVNGLTFVDGQVVVTSTNESGSDRVPHLTAWDIDTFEQTAVDPATAVDTRREIRTASEHFVAHEEAVDVFDPTTGALLRSLARFDAGSVASLAVFENKVAVGYVAGFVSIFDATTGERIADFPSLSNEGVLALAFSNDGARLAYGDHGGHFGIVDIESGTMIGQGAIENTYIADVAFTVDNTALAIGLGSLGGGTGLLVWDVKANTELARYQIQTDDISRVQFSPDGTLLATGSKDGTVVLWGLAP